MPKYINCSILETDVTEQRSVNSHGSSANNSYETLNRFEEVLSVIILYPLRLRHPTDNKDTNEDWTIIRTGRYRMVLVMVNRNSLPSSMTCKALPNKPQLKGHCIEFGVV